MDYVELEIAIYRGQAGYTIDMRFQAGEDCTALVLVHAQWVELDSAALLNVALDMQQYGRLLSAMLFAPEAARNAWRHARSYADSFGLPLRVRLRLDYTAPELHTFCWEVLQDPFSGDVLCLSERVLFSRSIDSSESMPLSIPQRDQLKALIVIANPANLRDFGLTPIDVAQEARQARLALAPMQLTVLDGRGGRPHATWANVVAQLAEGYDILYLVCHGSDDGGEAYLWLENAHGNTGRVSAPQLAAQVKGLLRRPMLVILATCQSAGQPHSVPSVLPLGATLARSGIGAVLAMHGTIAIEALREMMPVFLARLRRSGQIEQALAMARAAAGANTSWWSPVLWSRVRSGMLWREPVLAPDVHAPYAPFCR